MSYAEAAYFEGAPVAHCAAREDFLRLKRINATSRAAAQAAIRARKVAERTRA